MHELEANADSVNFLIKKLCEHLVQEGVSGDGGVAAANSTALECKLKAKAYEILLKKSTCAAVQNEEQDFEPERELRMHIFAAKLNAHGKHNVQESAKFVQFENELEEIENETYFRQDTGRGILQFLLALQGNVNEQEEQCLTHNTELLVPAAFTLHANYLNNPYYPSAESAKIDFNNTKPCYFKDVQNIKNSANPYLPKFLFDGETNKLAEIEQRFAAATTAKDNNNIADTAEECTFTGMARRLWGASMRVNARAFRLFGNCAEIDATNKQPKQPSFKEAESKSFNTTETDEQPRVFSWNWESLGRFGLACAKPFVSDTNVMLQLQSYKEQCSGQQFEAKILTMQQFMQDLKSLTVGIQSDTFQHDEFIVFSMQPHITVEGLLPSTIANYINNFLDCGTCYKRMQTMIMKRHYKLMFEGFMFKALCSAVDEYLLTVRQFVFAQHDEYLVAFYKRMKNMMAQLSNLSFTLAIHPNVDASVKPPLGSQFLGYLYREIIRLTEKDYLMLLMFILKRCCHVYFKHLQKWIFYGLLDDPSNELFICFVDHYRQNTKYFYDKAYFVRKESVPGFFQNYEDQILQCGKYTMLLKAYKPNHAIFNLEYPAITACLSFEEIQKLELACAAYSERARELCGKPITIREIFARRAEQKHNFYKIVSRRSRDNMQKWNDEQKQLALKAAAQKQQRLAELTTQLADAKQRKIAERRANVELELKLLRDAEKLEERRLLCDNINLRKRIEYYQELSDLMQDDLNVEQHGKSNTKLTLQIPNTQQAHTPASTAGSDFESCFGDEDANSLYAECISDDFVQKIEQDETELQALSEQQAATKSTEVELEKLFQAAAVVMPGGGTLKRSASDVINSNDLPLVVLQSELQRNRQRDIAGLNMAQCIHENDTKQKVATEQQTLTEAQRNKLKVLTQEFGSHTRSLPDINLNILPESELTDLQRNRKRMMQNDTFSEFNKDALADRAFLNLNLDTERSRNRRKVLESEFHILTGEKPTATTITFVEALTPMSTTSDTPLTESINESQEAHKNDLANNNNNNNNNFIKPELKINLDLVQCQKQEALDDQPTAATHENETPECALNTAGILARQGFEFSNDQQRKQQQLEAISELPIQNEAHSVDVVDGMSDYSAPYQRCIELIETNFKCPTRSPYIRLNMSATSKTLAGSHKSSESLQQLHLNSMSVITLTEFLKKSIIIPMSTHLTLVNDEVMRMFLEDLHVLDHLRSLRHYFFLMDGEFGAIICDGIIGKLEEGATPEKLLNYQMLHAILDNALGSSITGADKNAENLSFIVSDVPEKFDLSSPSVLHNLSLSYRVNWPLNLILNPETLEQYANIFKYLIKVRRISWVLECAYQLLKGAVKAHGSSILKSPQYRHVQQIRHKFYHFVHALQNHITANALQASWKTFKDELLQAKTMEDIYRKHTNYVKRILFLCMLNRHSVEFYNTIENIFKISLRFYNNLKMREFKLRSGDEHFTHARYEKLANDELEFDKFIRYTIYLGNKIVRHGYQEEIGEFINLINYNEYYMEKAI